MFHGTGFSSLKKGEQNTQSLRNKLSETKKLLNINIFQERNNSGLFGKKHLPLLATTSQPIENREHHTFPISPTCPPLGRVGKSNGRHKQVCIRLYQVDCFNPIEKIGNLPQIGVKIKIFVSDHHPIKTW